METKDKIEVIELKVCFDCASVLVMPETDDRIDETSEKEIIDKYNELSDELGIDYLCESLDRTDEFSHYSCEVCGSMLAGERFQIIGHHHTRKD